MDAYSRVTAIQIAGLVGSDDDKRRLKASLLAPPISHRALLGALIKVLYPTHLQMPEIAALLEAAPHGRDSAYDTVYQATASVIEAAHDDGHGSSWNLVGIDGHADGFQDLVVVEASKVVGECGPSLGRGDVLTHCAPSPGRGLPQVGVQLAD
jgi:hypothetical protein